MAVVDGQAVKAIMGEADRHNFELQPSEGTCQLAAAATTDEDRASLEAVVALARSAGCDIATIQLWKQLLAEDKDMKINSNSRRKVRLRAPPKDPLGSFDHACAVPTCSLTRVHRWSLPSAHAVHATSARHASGLMRVL